MDGRRRRGLSNTSRLHLPAVSVPTAVVSAKARDVITSFQSARWNYAGDSNLADKNELNLARIRFPRSSGRRSPGIQGLFNAIKNVTCRCCFAAAADKKPSDFFSFFNVRRHGILLKGKLKVAESKTSAERERQEGSTGKRPAKKNGRLSEVKNAAKFSA